MYNLMNGMNWNVNVIALTRHDTRCTQLSSKGEAVTTETAETGDTRDKVITVGPGSGALTYEAPVTVTASQSLSLITKSVPAKSANRTKVTKCGKHHVDGILVIFVVYVVICPKRF